MILRFSAAVSAVTCLSALAMTLAPDATFANALAAEPATTAPALQATSAPVLLPEIVDRDESLSIGSTADRPAIAASPDALPQISAPSQSAPASRPASLAALVAQHAQSTATIDDETRCLATAIFYESRGETLGGQLAVGRVIVNRARSGRFPASLCGVVKQPGQFSFVRGGALPQISETSPGWMRSVAIARIAIDGLWDSPAKGALFFHAAHVAPRWARQQVAQVDNHIFYR